jgi:hypothetical protein
MSSLYRCRIEAGVCETVRRKTLARGLQRAQYVTLLAPPVAEIQARPSERVQIEDLKAMHSYEVRPRKDRRGFDLISGQLPFGRLWYKDADAAIDYARFFSRSHPARITVFSTSGEAIETHEHAPRFVEP